jgi:hypothetical protein
VIGMAFPFGKGFLALYRYLVFGAAGEERDRVEWIEMRNLYTEDPALAVRFMSATAKESARTIRPVYHLTISFDPSDLVDRASMLQVADAVLARLGLSEHQCIIVAHNDTLHPHMHLMVNRVHPELLRAWENGWERVRIQQALRAQEVELGLRIVPGRLARVPGHEHLAPARALVRGDDAFLRDVQQRAGPVLAHARSWLWRVSLRAWGCPCASRAAA